ncbi:GlxA family transcriptional regulator [Streptomyces hoynatensis]|uniref:Helix-turn-helix domain-containing protein n=1 Tax=Streptomyces hoynatensis TaxID=1141874 RepID=A0A3A9Z9B8_9ACTN|nr:helix-turn-helix domain-containing protein [Streptomyces hoynatensis]RKN44885.1 helix-turn-helix domain-containing protein [Streptomyces hoynatensis]
MPGQPSGAHHVVVLVLPGVLALDLGIPLQVFGSWADGPYRLAVCAERPGPVPVHGGPALHVEHGLDRLDAANTVIVPGQAEPATPSAAVCEALARAAARGARMVSICTGAFALAAAGLLDGRRATTHWLYAADLAARHPRVRVQPRVLYVDEGTVLTSAGVAAGLDLCLHLIRRDHGDRMANQRARLLVTAPHRSGGQAQYIDLPVRTGRSGGLKELYEWALGNLHRPLTVDELARRAGVSRRTLIRRFHAETGQPPMRWLLAARLSQARELLESTPLTVEAVARRCGLGTPANFRALFKAHVGVPPSAYRDAFRPAAGTRPAPPAAPGGTAEAPVRRRPAAEGRGGRGPLPHGPR